MSKTIKTKALYTDGDNIRSGSKRKTVEYKQLKNSIKLVGMLTPITVYDGGEGYTVLDGHQRLAIAKELNMEEVPYYLAKAEQVSVQRLSANAFTIPMTPYEASDVMQALLEENPDYSFKQLSGLFGRDVKWVNNAIKMTNLIPEIKKAYTENDSEEYLLQIAEAPQQVQQKAFEEQETDDLSDWDLQSIARRCEPYSEYSGKHIDIVKKIIPLDVIRLEEQKKGVRSKYSNNLFAEYDEQHYCDDPEFLYGLFMEHSQVGQKILSEVPEIDDDMKFKWEITLPFKAMQSTTKFYQQFNLYCANKWSETEVVAWNFDVLQPAIYVNLKQTSKGKIETDNTSIQEKKDRSFKTQVKKIARYIVPGIHHEIRNCMNLIERKDDFSIVLRWLLDNDHGYDMNFTDEEEGFVNVYERNQEGFFNACICQWFNRYYDKNGFKAIDDLLSKMNLSSVEEIFERGWKEESWRYEVLSCLTTDELKAMVKTKDPIGYKKSDFVEYLTQNLKDKKFPLLKRVMKNLPEENISTLHNSWEISRELDDLMDTKVKNTIKQC